MRLVVAVAVIAATTTGLIAAVVISGLTAATEITSFIVLVPLAVGVLRGARTGRASQSMAVGAIDGSIGASASPVGRPDRSAPSERNSLLSIPGITFKPPVPWGSLFAVFWLFVIAADGVPTAMSPHAATEAIGWLMVVVGVLGLVEIATGQFGSKAKAIFDARPRLVVNQGGIYYRWNARRDITCPWERIVRVRAGARDGSEFDGIRGYYLVLDLRVGDSGHRAGIRPFALCNLEEPGFPADQIRGAIVGFAPSLLDQSLYEE